MKRTLIAAIGLSSRPKGSHFRRIAVTNLVMELRDRLDDICCGEPGRKAEVAAYHAAILSFLEEMGVEG